MHLMNNYIQTLYCDGSSRRGKKNAWSNENNSTRCALVLKELIGFMNAIVFSVVTDANFGMAMHAKCKIQFWLEYDV